MSNVLVYKDAAEGFGPASLVKRINNMCGSLVSNPRPDLRGDYVVTDIISSQVISHSNGWAIIAVVSVKPHTPSLPVAEVGVVHQDGSRERLEELFTRPVSPGEIPR
jgi:hypothetical protein